MTAENILESMRHHWPNAYTYEAESAVRVQRLAYLTRVSTERKLAKFDLSFTEFEILCSLRCSAPPHEMIPSDLYKRILISSGGLTKALKSLAARNLIMRHRSPGDRRKRPIGLTDEGRSRVEKAIAAVQRADRDRLAAADLTETERAQWMDLLKKVLPAYE